MPNRSSSDWTPTHPNTEAAFPFWKATVSGKPLPSPHRYTARLCGPVFSQKWITSSPWNQKLFAPRPRIRFTLYIRTCILDWRNFRKPETSRITYMYAPGDHVRFQFEVWRLKFEGLVWTSILNAYWFERVRLFCTCVSGLTNVRRSSLSRRH